LSRHVGGDLEKNEYLIIEDIGCGDFLITAEYGEKKTHVQMRKRSLDELIKRYQYD
jgi:hypothetical protein